jgi:hypothetical protein
LNFWVKLNLTMDSKLDLDSTFAQALLTANYGQHCMKDTSRILILSNDTQLV